MACYAPPRERLAALQPLDRQPRYAFAAAPCEASRGCDARDGRELGDTPYAPTRPFTQHWPGSGSRQAVTPQPTPSARPWTKALLSPQTSAVCVLARVSNGQLASSTVSSSSRG